LASADAQFVRALALEDSGKADEALVQYRALLAVFPLHADARHNHGLLLARLGRLQEAAQSHREYVQRHPQDPRAHSDLADVLVALGQYDEGLAALEATLQLKPDDAAALVRRGVALACLKRFDDARRAFAAVMHRHPQEAARFVQRVASSGTLDTSLSPENIFLTRRYWAQGACDWADWETYVAQAKRAAADPAVALEPAVGFMVLHLPLADAERHAILRHLAARVEARVTVLPPPGPRQRQRIRVGVLSPDYYEHLNAYLLRPLFELADRSRFELYAYSLGADDGSASRARIRAAADCFRDLRSMSDQEAAQVIRRDDVDILLDVGGYTTNARFAITAQRPARVHANYLAFPASFGSGRVDYAIVDRVAAPDQSTWIERLVHLPHTFFLYDYRATPQEVVSRGEYGLPEDAFVFSAGHKAEKITPECFFLWMEILRRVPNSVLWLLALPRAVDNLRRHAQGCGVDPARLVFAKFESRERYLARQRLADLMLDAFNHSALTTACDALGMGLPILTFGGQAAFASRAGESVVRAAGMPELVMASREEFVEAAVRLASDQGAMGALRDRLARNRTTAPLFDTAGRVRELEAAFERML
jgi:protein O-GlcNAc transferase